MDDVDPAGHTYPSLQFPVHSRDVCPDVAPYLPASHGPLQLAVVRPALDPYSPALQFVHTPAPDTLYVPSGHSDAVDDTEPAAHTYPALHGPEHDADGSPALLPYVPAGHIEHDPDPDGANLPTGHWDAVADTDPATHAYPAEHSPLHPAVVRPVLLPYTPAGHCAVHDAFVRPDVDPYRPTAHALHTPAPALLYCPAGHTAAVALVDPAAHAYPATQLPEHPAVPSPAVDPYSPAAHGVHVPDPPTLYLPATQIEAVGLVDPAAHAYPALQFPLHAGVVRPEVAPYVPAGHAPVHPAVDSPDDAPYRPAAHTLHDPDPLKLYHPAPHTIAVAEVLPAGHAYPAVQFPEHDAFGMPPTLPYRPAEQSTHTPDPPKLYVPAGHWLCVADVDPATHAYPAAQLPEHCDDVSPDTLPNRPAAHAPLQEAELRPGSEPYSPALQFVQLLAPAVLNLPAGHTDAVPDTDPATQKYPATQAPEHALDDSPAMAPYSPALQFVHTPAPATLNCPAPH